MGSLLRKLGIGRASKGPTQKGDHKNNGTSASFDFGRSPSAGISDSWEQCYSWPPTERCQPPPPTGQGRRDDGYDQDGSRCRQEPPGMGNPIHQLLECLQETHCNQQGREVLQRFQSPS